MRKTFLLVSIIFLIISCTSKINNEELLINLIPNNTSLVLRINDFQSLSEELESNDILGNLESIALYDNVATILQPLRYLKNQKNGLIAFTALDSLPYNFVYITTDSIQFDSLQLEKLTKKSIESSSIESQMITSYEFDDLQFFITKIKEHSILSSSASLLKDILSNDENSNPNTSLQKFLDITSKEKILNVWIDFKNGSSLFSQLGYQDFKVDKLASTMSLDLTLDNSEILLSGISLQDSTSTQILNLFSKTKPINNSLVKIAPFKSSLFKAYSLSDFRDYTRHPNQNKLPMDSLLNTVEEIGIAEIAEGKVVLLKTYGTASLIDYLDPMKINIDEISGSEIWQLQEKTNLFESLMPITGKISFNYGSLIENTFLFSESKKALETALINYNNQNVFENSNLFNTATTSLSDNASVVSVADLKGAAQLLKESISEELSLDLSKTKLNNHVFGSQYINDNGFFHTLFFIKNVIKKALKNSVTEVFQLKFKKDLAILPQFVINHNSRKKEVVVQDQNNMLYLISNKGKILWKKQIEGTIQGEIKQVDLYKNGKLQLAFTTNNQFLILDRNGKEVKPFTFKFEGGGLNPLAVFDYDEKRDYRFVVSQNNKLFMYNNQGKIVKGFNYNTTKSPVVATPQHFRISKKDYLLFKLEDGTLKIMNRTGQDRIRIKDKFSFSENSISQYQNKFSFTTSDGYLNQIDTKGKLSKTNLNLSKDHGSDATTRTLAIMNDNILRIRNKKVELELGVYSKPTIFYINDKIYVSVTDLQNEKIYMFDSQAEPIPNFPIYGGSLIDMADIDNDKRPEFVFKDQDNSIKTFKIQ